MIIDLPIPENSNVLVKKGDKINFDNYLFDSNFSEKIKINIADELKIKPEKIFHYLKKLVGEEVKKDDILAYKNNFLSSKKILSPTDGIIKEINHNQGILIIEKKSQEKSKIVSFVKGTVESIEKNFIKIKLNKAQSFSLKNKSDVNFGGEIFLFNSSLFFQIKNENIENKIIIAEKLSSFEQIKLEALGAKGFVTLESLTEKTNVPYLRLKNIDDIKKILKNNFSYCTVIENSDKIYFYL